MYAVLNARYEASSRGLFGCLTTTGFEWKMSPSRAGRARHACGAETSAVVTPVPKKQPRTNWTTSSASPSSLSAVLPMTGKSTEFGVGSGGVVNTATSRSAGVRDVSNATRVEAPATSFDA